MPFDRFFDYDRDGELDWLEKGARDAFIMNVHSEEAQDDENDNEDADA